MHLDRQSEIDQVEIVDILYVLERIGAKRLHDAFAYWAYDRVLTADFEPASELIENHWSTNLINPEIVRKYFDDYFKVRGMVGRFKDRFIKLIEEDEEIPEGLSDRFRKKDRSTHYGALPPRSYKKLDRKYTYIYGQYLVGNDRSHIHISSGILDDSEKVQSTFYHEWFHMLSGIRAVRGDAYLGIAPGRIFRRMDLSVTKFSYAGFNEGVTERLAISYSAQDLGVDAKGLNYSGYSDLVDALDVMIQMIEALEERTGRNVNGLKFRELLYAAYFEDDVHSDWPIYFEEKQFQSYQSLLKYYVTSVLEIYGAFDRIVQSFAPTMIELNPGDCTKKVRNFRPGCDLAELKDAMGNVKNGSDVSMVAKSIGKNKI